jgi:hypothetical protein
MRTLTEIDDELRKICENYHDPDFPNTYGVADGAAQALAWVLGGHEMSASDYLKGIKENEVKLGPEPNSNDD